MATRRSRRLITRCYTRTRSKSSSRNSTRTAEWGGRPVKFIFEDDENNPVTAASRVEKLAAQGASYIISIGSSATGIGAQAKADELKIPHGSPTNTAVRLSHPLRKYYFRLSITDDLISEAMLRFIKKKFSEPRVAVIRDATETGFLISDTQIKALKEAGLNVVAVEQITPGSRDVTAQALRIKEANPNVVLPSGGSIPDLANYVKAHKAVGNRALMLGNYLFTTASFGRLTGNTSDGFVFVDSVYPERPEAKAIESNLVSKRETCRFRKFNPAGFAWWGRREWARHVCIGVCRSTKVPDVTVPHCNPCQASIKAAT